MQSVFPLDNSRAEKLPCLNKLPVLFFLRVERLLLINDCSTMEERCQVCSLIKQNENPTFGSNIFLRTSQSHKGLSTLHFVQCFCFHLDEKKKRIRGLIFFFLVTFGPIKMNLFLSPSAFLQTVEKSKAFLLALSLGTNIFEYFKGRSNSLTFVCLELAKRL